MLSIITLLIDLEHDPLNQFLNYGVAIMDVNIDMVH